MLRLDKIVEDRCEADSLGMAEAIANNPVRKIVSAIDLESWLVELPEDDRALLSMRMAGHGWVEIGAALGISGSSAWSRCRNLGWELAERAQFEVPGEGSWEQN